MSQSLTFPNGASPRNQALPQWDLALIPVPHFWQTEPSYHASRPSLEPTQSSQLPRPPTEAQTGLWSVLLQPKPPKPTISITATSTLFHLAESLPPSAIMIKLRRGTAAGLSTVLLSAIRTMVDQHGPISAHQEPAAPMVLVSGNHF